PVPLTPTIRVTAGMPLCGVVCSDRSMPSSSWVRSSALSRPRTSSGLRVPSTLTLVFSSSTISRAGTTPTSAVIRTSSISSQVSSSRRSLDNRFSSAEPTELCDRASRARSRPTRPADGGGRSTSSPPVAAAAVGYELADIVRYLLADAVGNQLADIVGYLLADAVGFGLWILWPVTPVSPARRLAGPGPGARHHHHRGRERHRHGDEHPQHQ